MTNRSIRHARRYPAAHQSVADLWADLHARRARCARIRRAVYAIIGAAALAAWATAPAWLFIIATN